MNVFFSFFFAVSIDFCAGKTYLFCEKQNLTMIRDGDVSL